MCVCIDVGIYTLGIKKSFHSVPIQWNGQFRAIPVSFPFNFRAVAILIRF